MWNCRGMKKELSIKSDRKHLKNKKNALLFLL